MAFELFCRGRRNVPALAATLLAALLLATLELRLLGLWQLGLTFNSHGADLDFVNGVSRRSEEEIARRCHGIHHCTHSELAATRKTLTTLSGKSLSTTLTRKALASALGWETLTLGWASVLSHGCSTSQSVRKRGENCAEREGDEYRSLCLHVAIINLLES